VWREAFDDVPHAGPRNEDRRLFPKGERSPPNGVAPLDAGKAYGVVASSIQPAV